MPSRPDAYLLCGTPRTGSTLLCDLLRATGVAGRPESYFRRPNEPEYADRWRIPRRPDGTFDYRDYVRAAIAAGRTPNGVFAARVMWGTLDEVVAKLRDCRADGGDGADGEDDAGSDLDVLTEAFGRMKFVHLVRDDTVAQAVSWARAEQTQVWQPDDGTSPVREPRFDATQIHELVRTIEEHNAAWRDWFAAQGVTPYPLHYEDMVADIAGTVRGVLDYLGLDVPAGHVSQPRHPRQADEINADWIARYHALMPRDPVH